MNKQDNFSEESLKRIRELRGLKLHEAENEMLKAKFIEERFTKPTDTQYVDIALIFNEGKIQKQKLADMVAMAEFIVDRLYENGVVTIKSSRE